MPRFLIDTDTASDDAVALVMALRHPGVEVEAITVVAGNVAIDTRDVTHLAGFDLPDPITMAVALDPAVVTSNRRLFVDVETGSELCRGQTVIDFLGVTGREPNALVVLEASRERFLELLFRAVGEERP